MRYLSVCSGIEAATVAWHPLGFQPVGFAEVEAFPSAVLAHHFPDTPNLGDMNDFQSWPDMRLDLLVGGTPCQDASIGYAAGSGQTGAGFDGPRTGLAWAYQSIVRRYRPRWFVWENVPNLLSSRHRGDFLRFARSLAECGFAVGWRVLDAAGFGIADQPRRRIIMVGHRGGEAGVRSVLFERTCAVRDRAPRPEAAPVLTARGAMAFDDRTPCVLDGGRPRIATPLEWERAMGFPDGWTQVPYRNKPAADGPRYKALGNSMAVPVMRWIGQRLQIVDGIDG